MSRPEVKTGMCSAAVGPESYRRTCVHTGSQAYCIMVLGFERAGERERLIDSGTQSVGRMHEVKLRANRRTSELWFYATVCVGYRVCWAS